MATPLLDILQDVFLNRTSVTEDLLRENGYEDLDGADMQEAILAVAEEHGCATLGIPAISTGIYGYPKQAAAEIAVPTVQAQLSDAPTVRHITFCAFDAETAQIYRDLLGAPG